MKGALQERVDGGKTRCNVCAFNCQLSEGQVGVCRVRKNVGGDIQYLAMDTFGGSCPLVGQCGAGSFCFSKPSCNWSCSFCTSAAETLPELYDATYGPATDDLPSTDDGFVDKVALRGPKVTSFPRLNQFPSKSPDDVVAAWRESGEEWIAMRTTEPSIHFEAMRAIFEGVRSEGGRTMIHTNGFWTPELVEAFAPLVDVADVGLKGSANARFLRKVSGVPKVGPIFDTIKGLASHGVQVVVSDIPVWHQGWRDDFAKVASFIAAHVPQRDYPRLRLWDWQGKIPSVAFGHFKPGVPGAIEGGIFVESRAALLAQATEIALEHLDAAWVNWNPTSAEGKWLRPTLEERYHVAQEGRALRVAATAEGLGALLNLQPTAFDTDRIAAAATPTPNPLLQERNLGPLRIDPTTGISWHEGWD